MKLTLVLSLVALIPSLGFSQTDDFNDGNADGWTKLDPLNGLGAVGQYSFPNGDSYRLQRAASPDQDAAGPARIGALREDQTYEDFYLTVDVIDYNLDLDQNFDLLARVTDPGLGTLNGYSFTYNPTDQQMFFSVITDEAGENIEMEVPLDFGTPVRMVLRSEGEDFTCELYDLNDLTEPAAVIMTTDATWPSGVNGILIVADQNDPAPPTDCTFDNYFCGLSEPGDLIILNFQFTAEEVVLEFSSQPNESYALYRSLDLETWEELNDSIPGNPNFKTEVRITQDASRPETQFFQIRRE